MNITLWMDKNYFPKNNKYWQVPPRPNRTFHAHIQCKQTFNSQCLINLRAKNNSSIKTNHTWVTLISFDESIIFNYYHPNEGVPHRCIRNKTVVYDYDCHHNFLQDLRTGVLPRARFPSLRNETVAHWISNELRVDPLWQYPCIVLPRVNFGVLKSIKDSLRINHSFLPCSALPSPTKHYLSNLARSLLPSLAGNHPSSLAKSHLPCLAKSLHTCLVQNHHASLARNHHSNQARNHYPGPAKNYQPHQARNHLPSPVSSHPQSLVRSLPQSLANNHLPCLSGSHLSSPFQCHLLNLPRRLPLTLVNSHLPSQTKNHPQSLVRSHLPSPAKGHLPSLAKSLLTLSTNTSPGTFLPSLPHITSTLNPVSLTHVYHTSRLNFAQFYHLRLPQMKSTLHPVFFTYVYQTSCLPFTHYSHAQQHIYFSCGFLHQVFINGSTDC
jgi:hypothetical protein